MKKPVIILSVVLAIVIGMFISYVTGNLSFTSPYKELEFSVTYPQAYHLNIFADEGATFEGDWKSNQSVYTWYTSPGGCMYALGNYGDKPLALSEFTQALTTPYHYDNGEVVELPLTKGGDLDYIETTPPYGSRGYYTIYFKPFDEGTANIIVRYRVR